MACRSMLRFRACEEFATNFGMTALTARPEAGDQVIMSCGDGETGLFSFGRKVTGACGTTSGAALIGEIDGVTSAGRALVPNENCIGKVAY